MKTTTTRAWRRTHLNQYRVFDFDTFADYFLYLHLNSHVVRLHVLSGVAPVPALPWCVYALVHQHNPLPFLLFSLWFYGLGFISHWLGDGIISKTVKDFGPAYLEVILLNFRAIMGLQPLVEYRFCQRYPQVLQVYRQELAVPGGERPPQIPAYRSRYLALIGSGLLGLGLTQFVPALGWGLIALALFLGSGFLLSYLRELEEAVDLQDPLTPERQRILVAFSQRVRDGDGSQSVSWPALQAQNWWFWQHYRRLRTRALKHIQISGDPVCGQRLQALASDWLMCCCVCLADPEARLELTAESYQDLVELEQLLSVRPVRTRA